MFLDLVRFRVFLLHFLPLPPAIILDFMTTSSRYNTISYVTVRLGKTGLTNEGNNVLAFRFWTWKYFTLQVAWGEGENMKEMEGVEGKGRRESNLHFVVINCVVRCYNDSKFLGGLYPSLPLTQSPYVIEKWFVNRLPNYCISIKKHNRNIYLLFLSNRGVNDGFEEEKVLFLDRYHWWETRSEKLKIQNRSDFLNGLLTVRNRLSEIFSNQYWKSIFFLSIFFFSSLF